MTNQTIIFSVFSFSGGSIADVTSYADHFMIDNVNKYFNFQVLPVVVTPDIRHENLYTIQINYYDPTIQ